MIAELRGEKAIQSEAVAAGIAAVPRHLFAPREAGMNGRLSTISVQIRSTSYTPYIESCCN